MLVFSPFWIPWVILLFWIYYREMNIFKMMFLKAKVSYFDNFLSVVIRLFSLLVFYELVGTVKATFFKRWRSTIVIELTQTYGDLDNSKSRVSTIYFSSERFTMACICFKSDNHKTKYCLFISIWQLIKYIHYVHFCKLLFYHLSVYKYSYNQLTNTTYFNTADHCRLSKFTRWKVFIFAEWNFTSYSCVNKTLHMMHFFSLALKAWHSELILTHELEV